jgi:GNAT superfamily N-acetyltransferase
VILIEGEYFLENVEESHLNVAVQLAVDEYRNEQKNVTALYNKDYSSEIQNSIIDLFHNGKGHLIFENGIPVGFLGFYIGNNKDNKGYKTAFSPVYGYGINRGTDRGKIISLLFQHISELLLPLGVSNFIINLYAHDKDIIQSYVFNNFGIMCIDRIKNIDLPFTTEKIDGITFREFSKRDIQEHKETVLRYWRDLANHLRKSPAYYFGAEFTDRAYLEHISSSNTRLFTAINGEQIIAIVDASCFGNFFANNDMATVNISDLYVAPEFRSKRVAQGLLQYVSDVLIGDNYQRLWVEHGTVNPNALRFWSKYFDEFMYQVTRSIDKRIVDLNRG